MCYCRMKRPAKRMYVSIIKNIICKNTTGHSIFHRDCKRPNVYNITDTKNKMPRSKGEAFIMKLSFYFFAGGDSPLEALAG